MSMSTNICFTLSPELKEKIKRRAMLEGIKPAELIRQAIENHLDLPPNLCLALKEHFKLE